MKKFFLKFPIFVIIISVLIFFYPFILNSKLPVPSDTIIGLYYPFRDLYSKTNPNGIPYKNFLITDPVRQLYPWKNLTISLERKLELPLWNPYEMAGTPLLANFQSGSFYPLNVLLLIPPFPISWSLFIVLQPVLAGIFLYVYLKNLKLHSASSILGAITWAFSGFSMVWMEWGNVIHTALWFPLILLAIDKLVLGGTNKIARINAKFIWGAVYVLTLLSSFFAGHLQTFFYLYLFSIAYLTVRIPSSRNKLKLLLIYITLNALFVMLSLPQLLPTLQFISLSNRVADQIWTQPGWFIPYQNLIQFIAPDFFGNPSTLNYWGIWNYAEFVGYVGIGSLIFALFAVLIRRDKKTWYFLSLVLIALLFATQNPISSLPYSLRIPFISTAQPTRLMFIVDMGLAILTALGFDTLLKGKKHIKLSIITVGLVLCSLWAVIILGGQYFPAPFTTIIAKSNMRLPTLLFFAFAVFLLCFEFIRIKKVKSVVIVLLFVIVIFDLFRFGWKFTPFTEPAYLFPDTKITKFLQAQPGVFRIATADSRILPPNFSVMYKLQSIEGYDPLYLNNYATFIAVMERSDHSVKQPFGFNRIITPRNLESQGVDFLNVKYILSLEDISSPKFKKVFQSGQTRIYENIKVLPRAYFVKKIIPAKDVQDAASKFYEIDIANSAVMEKVSGDLVEYTDVGKAIVKLYTPNKVIIETENKDSQVLVVSDVSYPSIHATIDGRDVTTKISQVNIAFRGLLIPAGKHTVTFEAKLF